MTRRQIKQAAQDAILEAMIAEALYGNSAQTTEVSDEIIAEATKMARGWGISCKPGLPGTFPSIAKGA